MGLTRPVCALLFAVISMVSVAPVVAQTNPVANGEFDAGPVGWTWTRRTVNGPGGIPCLLAAHNGVWNDTPFIGGDRAAYLVTSSNGGTNGSWTTCGQIAQDVAVPVGAVLKFDLLLGTSYQGLSNTVSMKVEFFDHQLGQAFQIYSTSGKNCNSTGCTTSMYPVEVDISRFWGRTGQLRFRADTRFSASIASPPTLGSPAYVDAIRLEVPGAGFATPPDDGGWYNPARDGQGLHISTSARGELVVVWYTYTPAGLPVWYMSDIAVYQNGALRAPLRKFTWNPATGTSLGTIIGDIQIRTRSANEQTLEFLWDFHANGDNPTGYDNGENMVWLSGDEGYTGLWYEPALSGWGFSTDHETGDHATAAVFYYDGVEPVWAYGTFPDDPVGGATVPLVRFTGTGLCPTCKFDPVARTPTTVGQIGLKLETSQGWFNATGAASNWSRGSAAQPVALGRLTFP